MVEKWSDFEIARDAFWSQDLSASQFNAMDHADVVTWHNLAREVEQAEFANLRLAVRYGRIGEDY